MNLTPTEVDRLLLHLAAQLARSRRDRGLLLNVPEATAIVADTVAEAARDGRTHAEALAAGQAVLGAEDVLPGVADILTQVHVEAVFDDGSRLVSVPDPIGAGHLGDDAPGALLPGAHRDPDGAHAGAARPADSVTVTVINESPVPISTSSHFHFFEVNPRFGGGAPLSIAAGADLPLYLLQEVLGMPITASVGDFTDQLLMLRYDDALFVQVDDCSDLPGFDTPHFQ